jgi:Icc-related predicted phosphoesterase
MVDQRQPPESEHLGDSWLAKQIEAVKPRLVVSGHFHGGYGLAERNGTIFVNCSLANEANWQTSHRWSTWRPDERSVFHL